ncbi:hypothetical protein [Deinococcus gobiensis]|uniref:Uncharacterized protein n=1 Tax=Deinococcus gobiensis (strain DSM 21396 / JCM 16679 / CGMCC 1.7299 / I-0) TaxID=745776 RepID=H8H2N9_DEIGI|nr:hypothetical protein [Deinococcus gobiensis]AFD27786.1 hypothetical protein DGo_PB0517 [Deinococcus gobiensis I-0]
MLKFLNADPRTQLKAFDLLLLPAVKNVNQRGELPMSPHPAIRSLTTLFPRLPAYAGLVVLESYGRSADQRFGMLAFQDAFPGLGLLQVKNDWADPLDPTCLLYSGVCLQGWISEAKKRLGRFPEVALIDPGLEHGQGQPPITEDEWMSPLTFALDRDAAQVTILRWPT